MRFKAAIHNTITFTKFTASLASLGNVAWVRLNDTEVRFTIIPEQGTQVWAVLSIVSNHTLRFSLPSPTTPETKLSPPKDTIFEAYTIQSAADHNTINLEVPVHPLLRALRSASNATSASIRLTKKDNAPSLCITILTTFFSSSGPGSNGAGFGDDAAAADGILNGPRERETIITQDIPIRVLSASHVHGLHEPRCPDPDVHITLPPLTQLKAISDRFTRLALATSSSTSSALYPPAAAAGGGMTAAAAGKAPRLELAANMHGCLRLGLRNEAMDIASVWTGLANPELDPGQVEGGEEGVREHPSTRMRGVEGEEGWARCRIDGRDWGRVLSVGRLGGRVIACFCHEHALILYVYLSKEDDAADESVLTYYVSSYSA